MKDLHLGQDSSDLIASLGKPSKRRKSSDLREYWIYSQLKFEAIVSRKSARLLSLFFHRGCPFAGSEFLDKPEEQIQTILSAPPDQVIEGFPLADGEYFDRYIAYNTGISFFLDESGTVKTVCITARKRKAKAPAILTHRHGQSSRLAAFQRK